jgi:hypothetical protein
MQEPPLDKFGMNMYCNTFLNLFYEIYHHQLFLNIKEENEYYAYALMFVKWMFGETT